MLVVKRSGGSIQQTFWAIFVKENGKLSMDRRTNVQQLTCNIDLPNYFYCLFFSFVLIEQKPFVLKGKVLGDKF